MMGRVGTLEVHLLEGHHLKDTDFIGKSDPYAIICCRSEEQKSSTVNDGGANPKWNQSFYFKIDDTTSEITIKLFDKDSFTADDVIGTTIIPLNKVFYEGEMGVTEYEVVRPSGHIEGILKVNLKFTPERKEEAGKHDHHHGHHQAHGQHGGYGHTNFQGPYGNDNDGGWSQ